MSRLNSILLVGCLLPAVAMASFPIDVEINANGVSVSATSADVSNVATVTLTNNGSNTAQCEATFISGPERPFPRRTQLDAGESTVLTQHFEREITRVRVSVNCKAK